MTNVKELLENPKYDAIQSFLVLAAAEIQTGDKELKRMKTAFYNELVKNVTAYFKDINIQVMGAAVLGLEIPRNFVAPLRAETQQGEINQFAAEIDPNYTPIENGEKVVPNVSVVYQTPQEIEELNALFVEP